MKIFITVFLFIGISVNLQATESTYKITTQSLKSHIEVLAHDSLEGRKVGEPGELKAAEYIRSIFSMAGLLSEGTDNYFQYYDFIKEVKITENTELSVGGSQLILNQDFIPLKQSSSSSFSFSEIIPVGYGITLGNDSTSYNDYANLDVSDKAVLIARFSPPADKFPHTDFSNNESLISKINNAIEHNVSGIFFYTPEGHDDTMVTRGNSNVFAKEIPIIFLKQSAMEKIENSENKLTDYIGNVEIVKIRDTAQNVIGFLQGKTDTTVIIGAHYDHLGWGGSSSLYVGKRAIHNGADDNASGVTALLEMARKYASTKTKLHYSMLFIAFSGEESGLLGSNSFAKNMIIDSSKIRMMLNMDMIGRLKDQDNGLAILGVGTTEEFKIFFDSLNYQDIKLTLKESGTGPSDHTTFYNRNIPVLHLFTGAHSDYHKPSDDIEKIDFDGILKVTTLFDTLITYFDKLEKPLIFSKTKDSSDGKKRRKFTVSLGVMPDYIAEVKGLKIDGVMEDRPAEKAGILKGDIVVQLGKIVVNDIYDYMEALSNFRKGDTTICIVQRNNEKLEFSITF